MRPARARTLTVAVATVIGVAAGALATSATSAFGAGAPPQETALAAQPLNPVRSVVGADGLQHLAYELELSNTSPRSIIISSVEVVDPAAHDKVLTTVDTNVLRETLRVDGRDTSNQLDGGVGGILFLDVTLPKNARLPRTVEHHFSYELSGRGDFEFTGVPEIVLPGAPVVLAPPLRGGGWVVANGCCTDITAHRGATLPIDGTIHVPERYAIDFVQLDHEQKLFDGPLADNNSYGYFGADILAAAPGKVVAVVDGLPEQVPGTEPTDATVETAGGNHVVVDIGHGRFAFYAHLQPGSIKVKKGRKVKTGQVLGLLGNSGDTDGAQLHFHVMDGPDPLRSNGLPFELTSFTGEGHVSNDLSEVQQGAAAVILASNIGPHRNELPLNLDVVDFGK